MSQPDEPMPAPTSVTAGAADSGTLAEQAPASVAPVPPAPARRRRTGLLVGVIIAVVAVVAGGLAAAVFLNSGKGRQVVASPPTTATQAPVTVAPTATKYAGTLQALAIPMPAGASRESLRMGAEDGTLALDDVLEEYDDSARASVKNLLTSLEFERGLFLAWTDNQGFLVYVQIYQFHYEREAAAWSAAEARGLNAVADSTAAFDEILGGKWFTSTTPNGRSAAHARYSKGDLAVMISSFKTGKVDIDYLKRLAIDQYGRLP